MPGAPPVQPNGTKVTTESVIIEEENASSSANLDERRELSEFCQLRLIEEEQLGARTKGPALLLESTKILKSLNLVRTHQMMNQDSIGGMATKALENRFEPPPLAALLATAIDRESVTPFIRRVAASFECLLLLTAPPDLSPFCHHQQLADEVSKMMDQEMSEMMKNHCTNFTSHCYVMMRRLAGTLAFPFWKKDDFPKVRCVCDMTGTFDPPSKSIIEVNIVESIMKKGFVWKGPKCDQNKAKTCMHEMHTYEKRMRMDPLTDSNQNDHGIKDTAGSPNPLPGTSRPSGPSDKPWTKQWFQPTTPLTTDPTANEGAAALPEEPLPSRPGASGPSDEPLACRWPRPTTPLTIDLTDDNPKVFALAGFGTDRSGREGEEEGMALTNMVLNLGGEFHPNEEWIPGTTHLILHDNMLTASGLSEKTMCAAVSGQWILTKAYIENSHKAGRWLNDEEDHLAPALRQQVLQCRKKIKQLGPAGHMFHNMRAAVLLDDPKQRKAFCNVIEAGGGRVLRAGGSLKEVAQCLPFQLVTHVFMAPWVGHAHPEGLEELDEVAICDFKLLYWKAKGCPLATEKEWDICGWRAKRHAEERLAGRQVNTEEEVPGGPSDEEHPQGTQDPLTTSPRATNTLDTPGNDEDETMPSLTPLSGSPLLSSPGPAQDAVTSGEESDAPDDNFCVICQDRINPQDRCTFACRHAVHSSCGQNWLRVSPSCPTCRQPCNSSNPALLPPGPRESIVYGNGASLTNRPRPDGSSPLTVIINRAGSTAEAVTTTTTTTTPTTTATTGQRCSAVRQAGAAIQRCARAGSEARAAALQLSATIQRSGAVIQRSRAAIQRSARTRSEARAALNRATHQLNGIHDEGVPRARSVGTRNTSQPGSHWRNVNQRRDRQNTLRGTILRASRAEDASEIPRMELRLRKAFIDGFSLASRQNSRTSSRQRAQHQDTNQTPAGTRGNPARQSEVFMERFSDIATNAMYLIVICLMCLLIPRAGADMIEPIHQAPQTEPKVITSYRAGDILAFENNPRSLSLGMTSETIDVSILFALKDQLAKLMRHAENLRSNNLVAGSSCEHFCQPKGYAPKLTQVLEESLKTPHYVYTSESFNSPEKTFFVTLLEDSKGKRFCNYSLTHQAAFSLSAALETGSIAYYENREQKYKIYKLWIYDDKGRHCVDNVNVRRGEVAKKDADFEITINHSQGGLWGCMEACKNVNSLRETALKYPGCILGGDCQNHTYSRCEVYSYNWLESRCRISSNPDPKRDLDTYGGWNGLVASHQCRSRRQHQKALLLVNDTLHEVSAVCKFSEIAPPLSQHLYRSCPGVADSLLNDVLPLTTSLEGYIMKLTRNLGKGKETNNSIKVNLEDVKKEGDDVPEGIKRMSKRSIPVTALMATLRPSLSNFLSIGQAHLSRGIGKIFLGSALPMGNLLLLTTNILTMIVNMASLHPHVAHYDADVELEEAEEHTFMDWQLVFTPDLYKLTSTSNVCETGELLTADSVPSLLRGLHESLNKLQEPLRRVIEDPDPISREVREHIKKQGGKYGYWAKYDEGRKVVVRYFAFQVTGGPETAVTQVAVIAANSLSPVIQGTVVAGGAKRPGTTTPSWTCIAFVKEKGNLERAWAPKECYQSPILQTSEIYLTNFMPDGQLIRIWGEHSLGYSCPNMPPGIIMARGLLVIVAGRECQLTLDGAHIRPEDRTANSPWPKPVLLVDRTREYKALDGAQYPKSLVRAITTLANKSIHPTLQEIKDDGENESLARSTSDSIIAGLLAVTTLTLLLIILAYCKRERIRQWAQDHAGIAVNIRSWKRDNPTPDTSTLEMEDQTNDKRTGQ